MNKPAIRILLVDDESAIRRALRPPLMELGFQVAEASRGEEALLLIRSNSFDAVLLDINMPGIGGIETLRRIRSFAPRLPVLMLTVRDAVPKDHALAKAEFATLRLRLLKIGARIRETAHRVRIALAAACPEAALFRDLAIALRPAPA